MEFFFLPVNPNNSLVVISYSNSLMIQTNFIYSLLPFLRWIFIFVFNINQF
jgi:hypothetical protein